MNNDININEMQHQQFNSLKYDDGRGKVINNCTFIKDYIDGNGNNHRLAKFPVIIGKNGRRRSMIKLCDCCYGPAPTSDTN